MRVFPMILVATLSGPVPGGDSLATDPLQAMLRDDALMAKLAEMVILAAALDSCEGERAAFLIQSRDGRLSLHHWPTDCQAMRKIYRGVMPWNTVAIVHTHPDARRRPSRGDFKEARRLTLPVCVVTRSGISVAMPHSDTATALLEDRTWTSRPPGLRPAAAGQ